MCRVFLAGLGADENGELKLLSLSVIANSWLELAIVSACKHAIGGSAALASFKLRFFPLIADRS